MSLKNWPNIQVIEDKKWNEVLAAFPQTRDGGTLFQYYISLLLPCDQIYSTVKG